jgi:hypothetical protein
LWGCAPHWYSLPKELRDQVWRYYVAGQEISKTPTDKYRIVAKTIEFWIQGTTVPVIRTPEGGLRKLNKEEKQMFLTRLLSEMNDLLKETKT